MGGETRANQPSKICTYSAICGSKGRALFLVQANHWVFLAGTHAYMHTFSQLTSTATILLMRASLDFLLVSALRFPSRTSRKACGGLNTTTSFLLNGRSRFVTFSTASWSPTSNVGYMDRLGMYRGSMTRNRMTRATTRLVR